MKLNKHKAILIITRVDGLTPTTVTGDVSQQNALSQKLSITFAQIHCEFPRAMFTFIPALFCHTAFNIFELNDSFDSFRHIFKFIKLQRKNKAKSRSF